MGTILWIDQNSFASNFIEKVFKKKGLPFHTLAAARDFAYLVEDIKPLVIVLDSETARLSLGELEAEVNRSLILQKTPFITIGNLPEVTFIHKVGELKKPLDPFAMPKMIENILGNLS